MKRLGLPLALFGVVAVLAGCGDSSVRGSAFAIPWGGHDRGLRITSRGRGSETIDAGCCFRAVTLRFRITSVRGTKQRPSASAVVTHVHVYMPSEFTKKYPAPHVGEVGMLRIVDGVLHEPLTGTNYCGRGVNWLKAGCGA